ncbi:hypothetical protein BH11BAC2_BH11BAC2_00010 [soil metagenome]
MNKLTIILLAAIVVMSSCKKGPGQGGTATIKGNVHTTDYNSTLLIIQGEYPSADQDVYIIYGNDITYGDRAKSGPDGNYEFKYLREGDYKIYVYSDDTTLSGKIAVYTNVEITKKKQTVFADTLQIKKN